MRNINSIQRADGKTFGSVEIVCCISMNFLFSIIEKYFGNDAKD